MAASIGSSGGGNNSSASDSDEKKKMPEASVRFTGVILHVDVAGKLILVGDPAAGARPLAGREGGRRGLPAGPSAAPTRAPRNRYAAVVGSATRAGTAKAGAGTGTAMGGRRGSRWGNATAGGTSVGPAARTSIGGGGGGGSLLHTAKKRKLVYTGGKAKAKTAKTPGAASSSLASGGGIVGTGSSGTGGGGGLLLRTPRISAPKAPPPPSGPGAAALEVLRRQRSRGITQIVAVDVSAMPMSGWRVGDLVLVFGEVRPSATTIGSDASGVAVDAPSALQRVAAELSPSNGNGAGAVKARIVRNVNGTDVHLLGEALRLRRKHVRERCGWSEEGGTTSRMPGIGIEAWAGIAKTPKG